MLVGPSPLRHSVPLRHSAGDDACLRRVSLALSSAGRWSLHAANSSGLLDSHQPSSTEAFKGDIRRMNNAQRFRTS
jgi:hypothetical protein